MCYFTCFPFPLSSLLYIPNFNIFLFIHTGEGTDCPSDKFKNMRLVFNLAFCGSVAGNRFQMDCPEIAKQFDTCDEYVASNPKELEEAYWKIRGVYVYEREWQKRPNV